MRGRLAWLVLFGVTIAAAALHRPKVSWRRRLKGIRAPCLPVGRFGEIDVMSASLNGEQPWESEQKTKGSSDVYLQSNVWAPGGSTGWHSHPGNSLIIVTAGTVTDYEGQDPDCKPHVYKTGMGFVDPGGDHVHIIRNEGDVEAKTIAVQLIPADATRRIDAADPGHCHF